MAIINSVTFLDATNTASREILPAPALGRVNVLHGLKLVGSKRNAFGEIAHPDLVDPGVNPDIILIDLGKNTSADGDRYDIAPSDDPIAAAPVDQPLLLITSKNMKVSGTIWFEEVNEAHALRDGLI
jgi:hypothetical protein